MLVEWLCMFCRFSTTRTEQHINLPDRAPMNEGGIPAKAAGGGIKASAIFVAPVPDSASESLRFRTIIVDCVDSPSLPIESMRKCTQRKIVGVSVCLYSALSLNVAYIFQIEYKGNFT